MINIETYRIENEEYADDHLAKLFETKANRSMDVVHIHAQLHIEDEKIKKYFIKKAEELLNLVSD